jgi:predicted DNA-binding transcriptional regulator YafY
MNSASPEFKGRFFRVFRIANELNSGKLNSSDLAKLFGISVRTVHRDLRWMRDVLGFEIEYDEVTHNLRLVSSPSDFGFHRNFSQEEVFSLAVARSALAAYGSQGFFQRVLGYLDSVLSRFNLDPQKIDSGFLSFAEQNSFPDETALTLYRGIVESRYVEFLYESLSSRPRGREVAPLHVFFREGAWYVYALEGSQGRTFNLARIKEISLLERFFKAKGGFRISDVLRDSFGVFEGRNPKWVELIFYGTTARIISERTWHSSQQMSWEKDRLRLKLRVALTPDLERWILGWGENVTVLSPADLKCQIRTRLTNALNAFR